MPGSLKVLHQSTAANTGKKIVGQPQRQPKQPQRRPHAPQARPNKVAMPASLSQDLGLIFAQTKRCNTLRDAGRDVRAGIANTIRMIHTALAKADASEFLSEMKQVNPAQFEAFFLGMKARNIAETHAEIDKIQAKVQTIDQRIEEARRLNLLIKAGSGAGSDDDAGTPRSDTSTDSLDEAMRNHEPRRARGNSDDSDRSVAAGAVDDSAKSNSDIAIETIGNFKRADAVTAKLLTDYQQKARTSALAAKIHRDLKRYKTTSAQWRLSALAEMKTASRSRLLEFLIDSRNDLKQAKSFRPN